MDSFLSSGIDIEEFHSEIEHAVLKLRDIALDSAERIELVLAASAYVQMIFLFSSTINEIQNGPISETHRRIARNLASNDTILTFNWDTLMDRALQSETSWRTDYGYGMRPRLIFSDGWREVAGTLDGAPLLLKLHGSTNWLTSYLTHEGPTFELMHDLDPATVYIYERTTRPYPTYAGRYMSGYHPFSYGYYPPNLPDAPGRAAPEGHIYFSARIKIPFIPEGNDEDSGLVSMPLIVPPVKQKSYAMFGSLFSSIWGQAEDALQTASHIIVVGYSFPRTDHQSNELLLKALSRRNTMPKVTIVDPNPDRIADKFRLDYGINGQHLRVFKTHLSEQSNVTELLSDF